MSQDKLDLIIEEIHNILSKISKDSIQSFMDLISDSRRIFVAGSGRSGLMMKAFCMRLMQTGIEVYVVGETVTPAICLDDLLIIGSGSGETASLVSMAAKKEKIGFKLALITTKPKSLIGGMADLIVEIEAFSPKKSNNEVLSIQPLGSLFEQSLLLILDYVVMTLVQKKGMDTSAMMKRHANLE